MPRFKGNMYNWKLGNLKFASRIYKHRAREPLEATNTPSSDDWKIAPDVSAEQPTTQPSV
jgi:hypothetical protein